MLNGHVLKDLNFGDDLNDITLETLGAHLLFGEITTEAVKAAASFILKANILLPTSGELNLFINTFGGNCYDAFALIDLMQASNLPVRTIGLGSVMSMGVLLLCAGAKGRRVLLRNTEVMVHQFSSGVEGKYHEFVAAMKANEHLKQQFTQHFRRHTTMTERQITSIMFGPSDVWLTPTECKRYGLVDVIVDELPVPAKPAQLKRSRQARRARRSPPPASQ
jgi:ATP-dependent Clp protease protease subunit